MNETLMRQRLYVIDNLGSLRNDALANLVGECINNPRAWKADDKRRILREAARRLRWDDSHEAKRANGYHLPWDGHGPDWTAQIDSSGAL